MERMKLTEKEKDQIVKRGAEAMSKIIERMSIEMGELEEENKNLNKQIEQFKKGVKAGTKIIERLEEENKKLNIKVASLEGEIKGLNYTIEKLRTDNIYEEGLYD